MAKKGKVRLQTKGSGKPYKGNHVYDETEQTDAYAAETPAFARGF